MNLMLLSSDLIAAIFDVMLFGIHLTPYFYAAFVLIVTGVVLYEAAPSPADQPVDLPTPLAIEFRTRQSSSNMETEHAGNLSQVDEGKLT